MGKIRLVKGKKLYWLLTGRGFGSEICNLLYAINYSKKNNFEICFKSYTWSYKINKGFSDFFVKTKYVSCSRNNMMLDCTLLFLSKFTGLTSIIFFNRDNLRFSKINKTHESSLIKVYFKYLFKKAILLFKTESLHTIFDSFQTVRDFNIKELKNDRSLFLKEINKILIEIWKVKPSVNSRICQDKIIMKGDYVAFHIRRGDKIVSGEDGFYGINDYVDKLKEINDTIKDIIVMSDDYSVFLELKEKYTEFNFQTLIKENEKGHDQAEFNNRCKKQREEDMIGLLTEIEMAKNSKIFIGSQKSNLYRLIEYFKITGCYDISIGDCDYII